MIKLKKEALELAKFLGVLVIIYLVIVGSFRYMPFLNKYDVFVIQTDSMVPVINVSDIAVIDNSIAPEDIQIGDIMAFRVDITGDTVDDVVVHYVSEILPYGDHLIYKTISEKSGIQDSWTIEEEDIVGVYQFRVEYFGKILMFLQSWIGRVILVIDVIIISILYDMFFKKSKTKTKIDKEEPVLIQEEPTHIDE
jgi:signal peptidase I